MPRRLLAVLAVLTLLSGCMTRDGRRELTWEQGGYAEPEVPAFIGYQGLGPRISASGS